MDKREIRKTMQLLDIEDVTTKRQLLNGTVIWEVPIKKYGEKIRVGSFKSGYVRNMNCGYSAYQLNKCKPTTEYFKDYKWNEECTEQKFTGKYRKHVGKTRITIMDELERIEYLLKYCIKNYYIGYANQVEEGKFIPKWEHEWELKKQKKFWFEQNEPEVQVLVNGQRYKVI